MGKGPIGNDCKLKAAPRTKIAPGVGVKEWRGRPLGNTVFSSQGNSRLEAKCSLVDGKNSGVSEPKGRIV